MSNTALVTLGDSVKRYVKACLSPNTQKAYGSAYKRFVSWCELNGLSAMPASPETVAAYIAHLADQGKSVSTIGVAKAGIAKAHAVGTDQPSPTAAPIVKLVTAGITRECATPPVQASPLVASAITKILASLGDTLAGVRDAAILGLGFACALRRSEICNLMVSDLKFVGNGLLVSIRKSKTDQTSAGKTLAVPTGDKDVPGLVNRWLLLSGIAEGPLFRNIDRWGHLGNLALTPNSIAVMIKKRCSSVGIDPTHMSGHSLRSGFVTSAAESGADLLKIMDQTRHQSVEMIRRYIRNVDQFKNHAGASFL